MTPWQIALGNLALFEEASGKRLCANPKCAELFDVPDKVPNKTYCSRKCKDVARACRLSKKDATLSLPITEGVKDVQT